MIKSFSHKGLKDFFYDGIKKRIQPKHADKLELIFDRLNAAADIEQRFSRCFKRHENIRGGGVII